MNAKKGHGTSSTWAPSIDVPKDNLYKLIRGFLAIDAKMVDNIDTPYVARFALKSEPGSGIPDYGVLEIHKKTKKLLVIFRGSQVKEDWKQDNLQTDTCARESVESEVPESTKSGVHCGMPLSFLTI
jgi:hypothetical protein